MDTGVNNVNDPPSVLEGGYLIPETITVDKPGVIPFCMRWVGKMLGLSYLYQLGRESYPLRRSILELLANKSVKRP